MRKLLFSAFILLVLLLFSACNEPEEENKNEEIITPVETAKVKTGDFIIEKVIYGQISPVKQTPIIVQQPGEITSLKVENGDEVKKENHLATIKSQMGSQTIYAPNDGEIAHLHVQEGSFQSNEEPLMMIVDLDTLKISFTVTPTVLDQFKKDDKIKVLIDDQHVEAIVLAIDTLPNDTGQFLIEAELDNEDRHIIPGMTGKIVATDKKVKDTIIVPTEAIMKESDESFVYIVNGDVAEKITIEIKETQSEETAIKADLKKGDQVIINGQFTLSDNSKVEVVKEGK